jgi:hypothetical protein
VKVKAWHLEGVIMAWRGSTLVPIYRGRLLLLCGFLIAGWIPARGLPGKNMESMSYEKDELLFFSICG